MRILQQPHPLCPGLLHAVFVGLDHLLDHLTADRTGLTAGELTVIAALEIDADLGRGLHLELIHGLAGSGIDQVITGVGRYASISFIFIWDSIARTYLLPDRARYAPVCFE